MCFNFCKRSLYFLVDYWKHYGEIYHDLTYFCPQACWFMWNFRRWELKAINLLSSGKQIFSLRPHISKRAVLPLPSNEIILPLSLKPYSFLKVCGWYVFEIKIRDENGINLKFPRIQHPFQEIFFQFFSGYFCIDMWYS